jgi:3-oxoacyl-[acyl-carrier-protein] synthase-3
VAQRLHCDKNKVFVNLDRYGNTSAASVIVALSEAVEERRVKKGDLVLLTTFGAGLVWGSALLEWAV